MNQSLITRAELLFWNIAIQALSQSRITRSILKKAYVVTHSGSTGLFSLMIGLSGLIGLITGWTFYMLSAAVR